MVSPLPSGVPLARVSYHHVPLHVASDANGLARRVLAANLPLDAAFRLSAKSLRVRVALGLFRRLANEPRLGLVHGGTRANRALASRMHTLRLAPRISTPSTGLSHPIGS